ncbi:pyridoxal-phosphate dependent enzyme [candidate division KSB3 bacterium]|uniref:Pyridoxal-phosphate dependent enzyme n=1 Tax=candidate division KSB3 bacterium TaxID=2044937 RepID=A0A9D5JSF6_9BACT|nr:pyridoxal-phosphate dependent enzyme [candidate division KSB3 bacterium]MBD3323409.1 pyridoxal-phosphate dependent enzyme [candidate division KSB3 bacterium]
MLNLPTMTDVTQAAERLAPYSHRTPVLTSRAVNARSDAEVFWKCENFQKVGAFKFRGACNTVFSLSAEEAARGVITHSSGNHAAAVALAARLRGIRAFVVMPENAPAVKKAAVAGYGAEITFCESTPQARETTCARIVEDTGATFIHPSNDPRVIAGQGTAALELCEEVANLDIVMAPVGGGGLLSGTAIAVSGVSPNTAVIAAEPLNADDAYRSLQTGTIIPSGNPQTIADGLRTSLGDVTFPLIQRHVQAILTVTEDAIIEAMRYLWERMKIVIEPSAAVPAAALFAYPDKFAQRRVGIILSGGNVDLSRLPFSPHAPA